MFDDESQAICWFDTSLHVCAQGVPEGELTELMLKFDSPLVITERAYARPGFVKAVILLNYGAHEALDDFMLLETFVQDQGLDFISRPRSGLTLETNDGRYYRAHQERG